MLSIKDIERSLGQEGTIRFIEYSLPVFKENRSHLLSHLESKNWKDAAFWAHKMQATVNIFTTDGFSQYLDEIEKSNVDLIQTKVFKQTLLEKSDSAIQSIIDKYSLGSET